MDFLFGWLGGWVVGWLGGVLCCVVLFCFKTGSHYVVLAILELTVRPGWPQTDTHPFVLVSQVPILYFLTHNFKFLWLRCLHLFPLCYAIMY